MRDFTELEIWQESRHLLRTVHKLLEHLPESENYGLKLQICRSVVSKPTNIAKGCVKNSQKDFARFLQISLGSAFELEPRLIICSDLGFLELNDEFIGKIQILQKPINALIKYSRKAAKT